MGGAIHCPRCGKECTPGGVFCPHCGTSLADGETQPLSVAPAPRGPVGGKFRIVRELGRGGFGVVYEARDLVLDRTVALKTFRKETFATAEEREGFEKRFLREAKAVARLAHPNIVALYEAGQDQGLFYLAMEFVRGKTLRQLLGERGPLPAEEVREILKALAAALDHAHREGIVHRDIKPENVMIRDDGLLKVADFGVAKAVGIGTPTLTQAGSVMGTPSYMSPEQVQGLEVDGRADQFSTCAVAYEMLTGRRPFEADAMPALIYKIIHQSVPPPTSLAGATPPDLDAIVMRGLAKDREERFATCADLSRALSTPGGAFVTPPDAMRTLPVTPTPPVVPTQAVPPHPAPAAASPQGRVLQLAVVLGGALTLLGVLIFAKGRLGVAPAASPAPAPPEAGAPATPQPAAPDPRDARIEALLSRLEALEAKSGTPGAAAASAEQVDPETRAFLQAVAELQASYEALDVDGVMKLFHPEAEVDLPGGVLRSPEDIRDFYRLGFEQMRQEDVPRRFQVQERIDRIGGAKEGSRIPVWFEFTVERLHDFPTLGRWELRLERRGATWTVRRLEKLLPGEEELKPIMTALARTLTARDAAALPSLLDSRVAVRFGDASFHDRDKAVDLYAGLFSRVEDDGPVHVEWNDVARHETRPGATARMTLVRDEVHHWSTRFTFRNAGDQWVVSGIDDPLPDDLIHLAGLPHAVDPKSTPHEGFGLLVLTSTPTGAAVEVDGIHIGLTPTTIELPMGRAVELIVYANSRPVRLTLELTERRRALHVPLPPAGPEAKSTKAPPAS